MTDENEIVILDDHLWQDLLTLTDGEAAPCFQCGVCTAICPWGDARAEGFSVRSILRAVQLGNLEALENLWLCSACLQCEASCPRGVPISDVLCSLRYLLWKQRSHLHSLPATLWSCYWNNNPLGQPPSARMDWAADLNLPGYDASTHEWLVYFGCTASYDRRAQQVARSAVKVLRSMGLSFGVLGVGEPCCGESVYRLGHAPFFAEIAQKAVEVFRAHSVGKILVLSPHCFDVFRRHYPPHGLVLEVQHITQFLAEAIQSSTLTLCAGDEVRIAYHDPCLLGRGNGEYEAPRQILRAIPGVELVALEREREDGLCCGGGGGRMFLETPPGERFGDLRVQEVRRSTASILATACPLCITCLEDSMKVVEGAQLPVRDVVELVAEHVEHA